MKINVYPGTANNEVDSIDGNFNDNPEITTTGVKVNNRTNESWYGIHGVAKNEGDNSSPVYLTRIVGGNGGSHENQWPAPITMSFYSTKRVSDYGDKDNPIAVMDFLWDIWNKAIDEYEADPESYAVSGQYSHLWDWPDVDMLIGICDGPRFDAVLITLYRDGNTITLERHWNEEYIRFNVTTFTKNDDGTYTRICNEEEEELDYRVLCEIPIV